MKSGVRIVDDRASREENGAEKESVPEGFADSHFDNGQLRDSAENEVFEDTVAGVESIYTLQHLDAPPLKNALFIKLDNGMASEGNNGDLSLGQCVASFSSSTDIQVKDQSTEEEKLAFPEVGASISSSHASDIGYGQIKTSRAMKKTVYSPEGPIDSNLTISDSIPAYNSINDVENLKFDVETVEDSFSFHKLAKPLGKETDDDSVNDVKAEGGGEEARENMWNGDKLDSKIVEIYSVRSHHREIVSASDNENLGSGHLENCLTGEEASLYKPCLSDFGSEEDILNKHDIEEIENEFIDEVRKENRVKVDVADSLLAEEGSAYSNFISESKDPFKQVNGPISKSNSIVKEGTLKDFLLVEEINELSSTYYYENSCIDASIAPTLPSHPAGLGLSAPLLDPVSHPLQPSKENGFVPHQQTLISDDLVTDGVEQSDEIREKLQMIRVKFLRLTYRLGQTPHNEVVAQVLYRLGLAEQVTRNTNSQGVFSFDRASVVAKKLEASVQEPLDFNCTIMVIGKTGVGKSATINSIFDDAKLHTDAFQLGTKKIQNVVGTVQGIKVRVIDTPGLSSCPSDHHHNEKILNSIKSFVSKIPLDIVLYFDRLDTRNMDYGDVPLLRTITNVFGTSVWFNAIVVLTHACAAPPDGPNGTPLSYEMFVTQRSHVVQQAIRQAAGDVLLMNPVSLVENHTACRMNRAGQRVLPNGIVWKPQLWLLSFASKILHEAKTILKLEDSPPGNPFRSRARAPPLPFLLSSLLQSRPHVKLPEEHMGYEDNMFEGLEEMSDVFEYDELPPFKSLTKSQLAKLGKAQMKAYYEELDYREKLFFQKQVKEEKKHREIMKKMAESVPYSPIDHHDGNVEVEIGGPASIPVPLPDLALPNSFDSDCPTHRYRFLDSSNKWIVSPVLETQGWDHDVGYENINFERLFAVKNKIPLSISGQLTKDKKDLAFQMEVASSVKHNETTTSAIGFDFQTVGKDMACTLRGETKLKDFRCNNTAAGISITVLGDSVSAGIKFEDRVVLNKRLSMLISGGAMFGHGDIAYGGRFETVLRDKNYPVGRTRSTIALSIVDWHGDLAVGCNIQSQHPLGRGTSVICHGNLSNKGSGQVGIRLNTSNHLHLTLIAIVPMFRNAIRMLFCFI